MDGWMDDVRIGVLHCGSSPVHCAAPTAWSSWSMVLCGSRRLPLTRPPHVEAECLMRKAMARGVANKRCSLPSDLIRVLLYALSYDFSTDTYIPISDFEKIWTEV